MTHEDIAAGDLVLGVIAQALADDDVEWLLSDTMAAYCALIGLSEPAVFALRLQFLLGILDTRRLAARSLSSPRRDEDAGPVHWGAWPVLGR